MTGSSRSAPGPATRRRSSPGSVRDVTSLERQPTLDRRRPASVSPRSGRTSPARSTIREADGSLGDPAGAPWDGIIVTAAAPAIPAGAARPARDGGRLVIPVGPRDRQLLTVVTRHGDEWLERTGRLLRLRPAHRRRRVRGVTGPSGGSRSPDLGLVRTWLARYWLAVWFGILSAIRLSALVGGQPGFDGRLYLDATRAWLAGSDPWVFIDTQRFAAPPPSLVPLIPVAVLPEELGVAVMVVLAVDRRRGHDPPAPAALVVAPLPAARRRDVERQPADAHRPAHPRRRGSRGGLPQDLLAGADDPDAPLARGPGHGSRARRHGPVPAVGVVHRPVRRALRIAREPVGRRAVGDGHPVAHPGGARRPGAGRSRAGRLAGGPRALAGDPVVLLDARDAGPDPGRGGDHRRPGPGRRGPRGGRRRLRPAQYQRRAIRRGLATRPADRGTPPGSTVG